MLRVLYIEKSREPVRESYIQPHPGCIRRRVSLTYVFYAPRGKKLVPAPDSEIVFYPTSSSSKLTFPLEAVRLAYQLHRQRLWGACCMVKFNQNLYNLLDLNSLRYREG